MCIVKVKKGEIMYCSVICCNIKNDKHKIENNYEFDHKYLKLRNYWKYSNKMIFLAIKYKSKTSTCKCGSIDLNNYIRWHQHDKTFEINLKRFLIIILGLLYI